MTEIYSGNAETDSKDRRGWIVGDFIPDGLRSQKNVEIKYGVHSAGELRSEWTANETRTTLCLLVSGKFIIEFSGESKQLAQLGDYVMWGAGTEHKWHAVEDSVVLTVRWIN